MFVHSSPVWFLAPLATANRDGSHRTGSNCWCGPGTELHWPPVPASHITKSRAASRKIQRDMGKRSKNRNPKTPALLLRREIIAGLNHPQWEQRSASSSTRSQFGHLIVFTFGPPCNKTRRSDFIPSSNAIQQDAPNRFEWSLCPRRGRGDFFIKTRTLTGRSSTNRWQKIWQKIQSFHDLIYWTMHRRFQIQDQHQRQEGRGRATYRSCTSATPSAVRRRPRR